MVLVTTIATESMLTRYKFDTSYSKVYQSSHLLCHHLLACCWGPNLEQSDAESYLSLNPPTSTEAEDMNHWITSQSNVCCSAYNYTRTYISGLPIISCEAFAPDTTNRLVDPQV
jgi:hypothetical protein